MMKNNLPRFLPSRSFQGKKEGYVFKNGEEGVGYYVDRLNPFLALASKKTASAEVSSLRLLILLSLLQFSHCFCNSRLLIAQISQKNVKFPTAFMKMMVS